MSDVSVKVACDGLQTAIKEYVRIVATEPTTNIALADAGLKTAINRFACSILSQAKKNK